MYTNTPKEIIVTLTPKRTFIVEGEHFNLDTMVSTFGKLIPKTGAAVIHTEHAKVTFDEASAELIRAEKGIRIEHYRSNHRDEERVSSHDLQTSFGRIVTTRRTYR